MTINYDYYRIFYAVAQCRSFTRAAEVLKNNQPNITRCMKNLEQELGCKLFHRSNRGITLTPEGQRLYRRVAAAVEEIQLGEEEIRQDGSLESGTLSISASEAALHMVLLDKLSAFRVQYPGVHLRITNETTPQSIERLRNGESDFAVITAPQITDRNLQQDRAAAVPGGAGLRPRLQRGGRPAVHPGRPGPVPPGVHRPGHQYIRLLPGLFHLQRGDLPGRRGGRHHGPDPAHDRARPGGGLLPPSSWWPPGLPGGSCSASRWISRCPSGPSHWWRIPPAPAAPP